MAHRALPFRRTTQPKTIFIVRLTNDQEVYTAIGHQLAEAQHSLLFGKSCFIVNGKAFIYFFQQCMVFKLPKLIRQEALSWTCNSTLEIVQVDIGAV